MNRKIWTKTIAVIALGLCNVNPIVAQVISFSMEEEKTAKNTPDGWTEVNLPKDLPTFTEANTFYINDAKFGASTTAADNTEAIQKALDAANDAGGGMVVVPQGEWLFGRITIGSKTVLHLCKNATLKLIAYGDQSDHTTKVPYITDKKNASDIVIEGESKETSIIEGQGAPWWDAVEAKESGLQRGSIIRMHQGERHLFRNFRIQNAPGTNLTLGQSGKGAHNTVHDISIYAPASSADDPSHNTDGIPIWTQYANIYNCDIDTGDDNVVTDSDAQYIHVWNCNFKAGHGASLGSYTVNMHHIIYEDLTFNGTEAGFRLKSNNQRSGKVHDIIFRNCTMTNVANPISLTCWYDLSYDKLTPEAFDASPETKTETTPEYYDILIQNVKAEGYNSKNSNNKNYNGIYIFGRPESYIHDVTFDNVQISHRNGVRLFFCKDIKFINDCTFTKTSNNTTVMATDNDLSAVMENSFKAAYNWHGNAIDTAIRNVNISTATESGAYYNLQGQRLEQKPAKRGIYIQNGKKWMKHD